MGAKIEANTTNHLENEVIELAHSDLCKMSEFFVLSRCKDQKPSAHINPSTHTYFVIYKCLIKTLSTFQPEVYVNHVTIPQHK